MNGDDFISLISGYDTIVVLDSHQTFKQLAEEEFNQSLDPGQYRVSELIKQD